jgi:hypothetical protein
MVKLLQAIAGAPHGGAELFFTRLAIGLEEAGQQQIIRDAEGQRTGPVIEGC